MDRVLRVLVVDDSAYVRKAIKQTLLRSPFIDVVGIARNGLEALELVEQLEPDVVILDLIMPLMNGVEFLREQMARKPVPVVVVSIANEESEMALAALEAGAIDFVQKPTALATERILEISNELIATVKAAANASVKHTQSRIVDRAVTVLPSPSAIYSGAIDIVVIGISTGGPQALRFLIPQLSADFPVPVAVVMHMPVGYTEMYARKLDEISPMKVVEAREGDELQPGKMFLAPAGRHMSFRRIGREKVLVHLDARPFDTPHRPSVDVLFQSAAEIYHERVLGVVLTGMGSDGKQGSAWIKAQGGMIFTESEDSCVVYGMPRSVVEAGLSDKTLSLDQAPQAILEVVYGKDSNS
jgi:two-component system chemotaxis response regulator CheB